MDRSDEDEIYTKLRSPNWRDRFDAVRKLEESVDAQDLPIVCELLQDVESGLRVKASWMIARLMATDKAHLVVPLLTDPWWGCRRAACSVLARLGARQFATSIASLTADESQEVRHAAVDAIVELGASECTASLTNVVKLNEKHVGVIAASGLARFGAVEHLDAMFPLLSSPELLVRRRMIAIISSLGDPRGAPHIAALLSDPDTDVRDEALLGLARLLPNDNLPTVFERLAMAAAGDSETLQPNRLPFLARSIRMLAAANFAGLGPTLRALLEHADGSISGLAALALGRIQDVAAIPALRTIAAGTRSELHLPCLVALVRLGMADSELIAREVARFREFPRDSCFVTDQELEYGAELAAALQAHRP